MNGILKSTVLLSIFSLLSKFLGFIRETLIASRFGSHGLTDAFFIALTATSILGSFLSAALGNTMIPILSDISKKEGGINKLSHTNNIINIFLIFSLLLTLLGIYYSPTIVNLLAKNMDSEYFEMAIKLTRLGFPMIVFSVLSGIFIAYLRSYHRHLSASLIGFPFNGIYILYLLLFSSRFGIKGLMLVAVVASISQLLILLPEAHETGYRYEFIIDFKDKYILKALELSLPILLGTTINDLNKIVDQRLASGLVAGSVSSLNYANKLNGLILGVFIAAITTVIFPILSEKATGGDMKGLKISLKSGIDFVLLITIPATVGMMVLSTPIVQVAFERGSFDRLATKMTSSALIAYSVGLVAMSINQVVTRVYYALQDTKTPMINAALSLVMNIGLNLILVDSLAHTGLALATSISTTIATFILLLALKKKLGGIGGKDYLLTFIKVGFASIIMGIIVRFSYEGTYTFLGISKLNNFISLGISVLIGVFIYGVLCYILGVEKIKKGILKVKDILVKQKLKL